GECDVERGGEIRHLPATRRRTTCWRRKKGGWWCQVSRRIRTWMSIRWIPKLGTRLWPCSGSTLLPDSPFSIPMATPPTSAKCMSSSSSSGLISESTSCAMTIQAMEHLLETRRSPAS
ncbi:unnamed protein product, partial [Linum tenue]